MTNWQLRSSLLKSSLVIGLATVLGVGSSIGVALVSTQTAIAQEQTPAEETPVETAPAEAAPAEETPTEEAAPAEETPTEEAAPAEETPAPAEETPAPTEQAAGLRSLPIVLVSTAGETANTRTIPGYQPRFSQILGSGALLVNDADQVTGYYFATTGLEPSQTLAYHVHNAMTGANPTSCEGDKALLASEVAGGVLTDLAAI